MYRLIIDGTTKSANGTTKSANGTFENFNDALWWYNYALQKGASSAALWQGEDLITYFIKEKK